MKTLLVTIVMTFSLNYDGGDGKMTKEQRDYLVSYLKDTEKNLFKTLKGVSQEQWTYKPSDDVWSIAQICDHLMNAEENLSGRTKGLLQSPPDFEKDIDIDARVASVVDFISEKNRKTRKIPVAPGTEPEEPSNIRWSGPKEFVSDFKKKRDENIDFIKNTDAPLLAHYNPLIPQLGEMNSYLWTVFMAAHSSRHTYQIKEVMENQDYPTN